MVKERSVVGASQVTRFFRVLLSGFSQKLSLPRAFVKRITSTERRKRRAELVNPRGRAWRVRIVFDDGGDEGGAYFGGGSWRNFLDAHGLRPGFFLVFRHRGGMVFDFRAYDLSTCEVAYPTVGALLLERRRGPEKRRGAGADPRYVVVKEEELDDDANERPEEAPDSRSSGGRATVPHVCFEAKMTFYNLTKPYMYFPIGVIRQCSELSHLKEITLKDPELRLWETQIFHRKSPPASGSGTHIARGWLEFAQANKLNIGDRCVFELVPRGGKMTMNVQIIRKM